jgi:hypothetical protein
MMQAVLKRVPMWRLLRSQSVARSASRRQFSALVDEAHDTYELMDSLLARLDNDKPAFIFLDVDETLVTRDTCLVHGFQHTTHLLLDLEQRLAARRESTAAAILARMRSEMERDYYGAYNSSDSSCNCIKYSDRHAGTNSSIRHRNIAAVLHQVLLYAHH